VDVTIIGAGNMARGIGSRLIRGARVQVLDRDPARARALAQELGIQGGQLGQTPIEGEVVVLAVPYAAIAEIADRYGDQLHGRIVVDISNPVDFTSFDRLVTPPGSSAAEEIEKLLPGARVVKAFNTTFAATLVTGAVAGHPLDVFIASDDSGAAKTLAELVEAGRMRPTEAGPLRRARELEAAGFLHMAIQQSAGGHFSTALKILH
jgi:8-hydroxy-5-deazaflavin:NADPH oxidoreductase